jgi:hypothetical protein
MPSLELDFQSLPAAGIVRIQLTAEQGEELAPLVHQAAANPKNLLFFALAVPFWREDATVWELQTIVIPASIGHKIIKLVRPQKGAEG